MASKTRIGAAPCLLVLLGVLLASAAGAAENCPWMNEATASGILGADATGLYMPATAGQPGVCTFSETGARAPRTLEIRVQTMPDAHERLVAGNSAACSGPSSPLPATGNEAIVCAAGEHKEKPAERAIGRVRDQLFTITLTSSGKQDDFLTRDELKTGIATAAEQVAGKLF